MKTILVICMAALGLSAASWEPLKVNLATPVVVGNVELAPGACTIQEISNGSNNVVLLVRSQSGATVNVLVNRISEPRENHAGVVLKFEGGRYQLDQVWLNDAEGFQVLRSGE